MPSSRMMRRSAASNSSTMIGARPSSGSSSSRTRGLSTSARRDRQHLLLAAGQLVAEILPALVEPREQLIDLVGGPAAGLRDRGQVFLHGERFENVALLRHPADADMGALIGAQPGDVGAVERNRAAEITGDADDGIDQRGLAHAVAAEQGERLAFGERQRDVGKHDRFAVTGARAARWSEDQASSSSPR